MSATTEPVMVAKRVQRRRTQGWRMPEGAVNVTRPCEWSNPFKVGASVRYGYSVATRKVVTITPAIAVALFEAWIIDKGWTDQIRSELAGKDLVCWCPLDEPCHADVLLRVASAASFSESEN